MVSATASSSTTQRMCAADYDYSTLLNQAYYFYEAQRSGPVWPNKRVDWRQDSALGDAAPTGESLTGGQYDAGGRCFLPFKFAKKQTSSSGTPKFSVIAACLQRLSYLSNSSKLMRLASQTHARYIHHMENINQGQCTVLP